MRLRRIQPLDDRERVFLSLLRHGEDPGKLPLRIRPEALEHADVLSRILGLALSHNLAGWLYDVYKHEDWMAAAPAGFREELRLQYIRTSLLNTRFIDEFSFISKRMNAAGLEPLVLKGGALITDGVEDTGRRHCADLDILVGEDRLADADRVLREAGYRIDESTQPAEFYRKYHFHYIYRNPQKPWCCLELHWNISVPAMGIRLPIDEWVARSRTARTDGETHRVFSTVDFLLHMCLHASLNHFSTLSQIRDIHSLLIRQGDEIDPSEFWTMARFCRISVPAAVSLVLARVFGRNPQRERLISRAGELPRLGPILPLVDIAHVLRRDMLATGAYGRAVSLMRRDRLLDRLSFKFRQAWPSPADFGLDGHPEPTGLSITDRFFSWRGFLVLARMETSHWLSRNGWEVVIDGRRRDGRG